MTIKPDDAHPGPLAALLAWKPPAWMSLALAIALIGGAWWIIYLELREHSLADLWAAFLSVPTGIVIMASIWVVLSFLSLVLDEWLSLKVMGVQQPFKRMMVPAFTTYALANALSFSFATAPAVRTRLYRDMLKPVQIGTLSAVTGTSVFVGASFTTGFGMLFAAAEIAARTIGDPLLWRLIGAALLIPALVWVVLCFGKRHSATFLGITLTVPLPVSGMAQLFVAVSGWMTAAAVLWALLPNHGGWSFPAFSAVFVAACYLGAASGAPAGVGVFDAAILAFSSAAHQAPETAAAIIVYRLIYTLVPLAIGGGILGRDLARTRRREPQA